MHVTSKFDNRMYICINMCVFFACDACEGPAHEFEIKAISAQKN